MCCKTRVLTLALMTVMCVTTGARGQVPVVLPFALHEDSWNALVDRTVTNGDTYSYSGGTVTPGADGLMELNLYPGSHPLLPDGFGTLDICEPNSSTAVLARQILEGPSADDLAACPDGALIMPMDFTGDLTLSAQLEDDLEAIIGQPRALLIFEAVSTRGNSGNFTVVDFANTCVRVMAVNLKGPKSERYLLIQQSPCDTEYPSSVE